MCMTLSKLLFVMVQGGPGGCSLVDQGFKMQVSSVQQNPFYSSLQQVCKSTRRSDIGVFGEG